MGGRSRAAAQLLAGKGFKEVYNLKGGIKAWQGLKAEGPAEMGMILLSGDETESDIISIAYGMENGLEEFYSAVSEMTSDTEAVDILAKLEKIEEPKEFSDPEKSLIKKIETMLKVSTRIKLNMMREALGIDEKIFSEKIFEWAEKFDFVIDGEYLIIKAGSISAFVKNLLLDHDLLKQNKKKHKKIICQLCGKKIDKNSKVCPYCGAEIKKT